MKAKYIGFGEYPTLKQLTIFRKQCPDELKKDAYIYFKTSKGIKKRKLFDNTKQ